MEKSATTLGRRRISPDGEKRNKRVSLDVTPAEFSALNEAAKAAGLSRAEYILQSTVYADGTSVSSKFDEIQQLVSALNEVKYLLEKEGGNLNQIAYGMNAARKRGDDKGAIKTAENLTLLISRNNEIYGLLMKALREIPAVFRQAKKQ